MDTEQVFVIEIVDGVCFYRRCIISWYYCHVLLWHNGCSIIHFGSLWDEAKTARNVLISSRYAGIRIKGTVRPTPSWWSQMSWFQIGTRSSVTVTMISLVWWGIKWKHFPRYWPFMRGIHPSPVNSPLKGQWRGALMFSLLCAWISS